MHLERLLSFKNYKNGQKKWAFAHLLFKKWAEEKRLKTAKNG